MSEIRFDDIEALRKEIREEFGPFGAPLRITQEMIQQFADLTGDQQWIHVDVERARREGPFGGPIAHGFLLLALLPRMRGGGGTQIVGYGSAANYGSDGLRFLAPVPAGSEVHARSRLAAVEAKPRGTLVSSEIAIHVVGSEKPALTYKSLILYGPPRVQ
jgi:acyl dehydratase